MIMFTATEAVTWLRNGCPDGTVPTITPEDVSRALDNDRLIGELTLDDEGSHAVTDHYIEITAVVGPIDPPHALHTFDDGKPVTTAHGVLADRLMATVWEVDHDANVSAKIVNDDELDARVDVLRPLLAERDGWRAENDRHRALYIDAVKDRDRLRVEKTRLEEQLAHEMCAGQSMEGRYHDAVDERDRLRTVVGAVREMVTERRAVLEGLRLSSGAVDRDAFRAASAADQRMLALLAQLDGSPVGSEVEP